MADLAFGILALPETIENLVRLGRELYNRIDAFKNAPRYLEEVKVLGYDLYNGQLRIQLDVLSALSSQTELAQSKLAQGHARVMLGIVFDMENELRRCIDGDGEVRRLYFAHTGERHVRSMLKKMRGALKDFQAFIVLIELRQRLLPDKGQLHLTRDRFSVFGRYDINHEGQSGRTENVRLAKGELRSQSQPDSMPEEVTVLLEKQPFVERHSAEVRQTAIELSRILSVPSPSDQFPRSKNGILQCLGYRTEPSLDLVFLLPPEIMNTSPKTLQAMICQRQGEDSLEVVDRLRLSYEIVAAVGLVHAAQFVHKSIRTETILVFETSQSTAPQKRQSSTYRPFLSGWSFLRSSTALTARVGTDDWTENIYRHPSRQGLYLESRYNLGHDIYSLGVTLLELGLWESFIVWSADGPDLSTIYRNAATKMDIGVDEDGPFPSRDLLKPANVYKIMLLLSQGDLAERMGSEYASIVQNCLRCVEEGLDGRSMKGDVLSTAEVFQKLIAGPMFDMVSGD